MNFDVMCQRLKCERIKADLSQKQVGHITGITQSHYVTYEKGNNTIPITRLIKLSKTYKISID